MSIEILIAILTPVILVSIFGIAYLVSKSK